MSKAKPQSELSTGKIVGGVARNARILSFLRDPRAVLAAATLVTFGQIAASRWAPPEMQKAAGASSGAVVAATTPTGPNVKDYVLAATPKVEAAAAPARPAVQGLKPGMSLDNA